MQLTRKVLIEALGLKPGDKITAKNWRKICTISDEYYLLSNDGWKYSPYILMDVEFEIVQPKKKIGDLICIDVGCKKCPLCAIQCKGGTRGTLYNTLEETFDDIKDDEIYKILKARLDMEVEE